MNPSDQLQLTVEDKDRYEKRISEIPDSSPLIGLLDDYVLVRWVVDSLMADYSELFEA